MKVAANKIDDLKAMLEKQIETYQRKSELIGHRDMFIAKRELLLGYIKDQGTDYDENLDTHQLKLVLTDNRGYRDDGKISISNNMIVRDIIGSIISRINIKVAELEKEIVA
ncbi:hypothetical protein [Mariniphaga sediminis]|uniref:hypothetical protein n=1 Tax=Mariniphaga sediminis TaxID=1628158 RepID=UPI0035691820